MTPVALLSLTLTVPLFPMPALRFFVPRVRHVRGAREKGRDDEGEGHRAPRITLQNGHAIPPRP